MAFDVSFFETYLHENTASPACRHAARSVYYSETEIFEKIWKKNEVLTKCKLTTCKLLHKERMLRSALPALERRRELGLFVRPREKAAREERGCRGGADGRAARRARSFLIISVQARTRPVEELNIHSFSEEFDENRATRTSVH